MNMCTILSLRSDTNVGSNKGKRSKESHESHGPHFGPSTPSGMGPPGHRHAPPPLPPPYPRVPLQTLRPTEDDPKDQRFLSAHLPAAPSRRGCLRSLAADDYPRLIPTASLPHDRGCPRSIADEFPLCPPWRRSGCLRHCAADDTRSASLGVEADACGIAPRMNTRSASLGVEADACALSRMNPRSAPLGAEADACANPQMISRAPTLRAAARAAEGALATLILTPSPSLPTVYAVSPDSDRESIPRVGPLILSAVEGSSGGRPTFANPSRSSSHTTHERTHLLPHTPTISPARPKENVVFPQNNQKSCLGPRINQNFSPHIRSGTDIPISSKHRANTMRDADTSLSRALESGRSSLRTRHFS